MLRLAAAALQKACTIGSKMSAGLCCGHLLLSTSVPVCVEFGLADQPAQIGSARLTYLEASRVILEAKTCYHVLQRSTSWCWTVFFLRRPAMPHPEGDGVGRRRSITFFPATARHFWRLFSAKALARGARASRGEMVPEPSRARWFSGNVRR